MENIQSCTRIVNKPHLAKFFQNGNECFKIGMYVRPLVKVNGIFVSSKINARKLIEM